MPIKVFVSHNHKDYELAKEIKYFLENFGLDVFVAHKDIEPTKEWVEEIHQELKSCDIFIPLLTKSFYESKWTDQESGIAFTHNKKILSIKIDEDPRGFINKWQALHFDNSTQKREKELRKIFDKIALNFPDRIKHTLITSLERPYTSTFRAASSKIGMLIKTKPFTKEEINTMMRKISENDQIYDNNQLRNILKNLIEEYSDEIEFDVKEKIMYEIRKEETREMLGGKSLYSSFLTENPTEQEEKKPSLKKGLKDGL